MSTPAAKGRRGGRRRAGEQPLVPDAQFQSYYGKPVINEPTWEPLDIAGYLFLGGLAGASSVVAAGAQATSRPALARVSKLGSTTAIGVSLVALVHDLGRPARFVNMLRTFKPTSPMSVGSWVLSVFAPASAAAAFSELTGTMPAAGAAATAVAATLGPVVASYTGVLVANTSVPAWHSGYRYMPFLFVSSAASAAAGLSLVGSPMKETGPVQRLAVVAGITELALERMMQRDMGLAGEALEKGKAKRHRRRAEALTAAGVVTAALLGRRSRAAAAAAGAALLAGSAFTRFAVFEAGLVSARDPKYTVVPQRQRVSGSASPAGREMPVDG